jgi:osmotically-inducible protein OsmY
MSKTWLAIAVCLACCSTAAAQFTQSNLGGGRQSQGAFGSRTLGGGSAAFGTPTSGTLGGGGMGGFGTPTMGMGAGGTGAGGMGSPAMGGMGGAGMGMGGAGRGTAAQPGFATPGGFVGGDASTIANVFSAAGQGQMGNRLGGTGMMGGMGGMGAMGQFGQLNRMNQMRQQQQTMNQQNMQQGNNRTAQLRVSLRADIPVTNANAAPTNVSRQFESRLQRLPGIERGDRVSVTIQDRTAILTGSVSSERERSLVEGLAMLEPGISAVQNNLVVEALPARVENLPPPRR